MCVAVVLSVFADVLAKILPLTSLHPQPGAYACVRVCVAVVLSVCADVLARKSPCQGG
jgi:hypothetical protein